MRVPFKRSAKVPADVLAHAGLRRGERVLARAKADDGTWLLGTRDALVIISTPGRMPHGGAGTSVGHTTRVPWERVEAADWDRDEDRLRVSEVAAFGQVLPVHVFVVADPGLLLQLVRERVTASVLVQRRVPVSGKRGLTVIARRPPRGHGELTWAYELDAGVDPDDPAVQQAASHALRAAQDELGQGQQPI